jgi:drug/metabolite transporter (DMT)-like permease
MFIGEALCLLVWFAASQKTPTSPSTSGYAPVPGDNENQEAVPAATEASSIIEEEKDTDEDDIPRPVPMQGKANLLLWIPTLCDLTATTLMNVGLIHVSASIYQMLRGSVVLFTGILSTLFLGIRHPSYRWFALVTVFIGVAVVGLAGIVEAGQTTKVPVTGSPMGIGMVVLAQVFTALQFVIEVFPMPSLFMV